MLEAPEEREPPEDALGVGLELTRLVADRMAEELRDVDCAPLELDTVTEPSAATLLPPLLEPLPLLELADELPEARELTWLLELREALNDRPSRPKPDRDPRNCGASNCANRSAPVEPVSRIVLASGPATAFAVRTVISAPPFFSWANAWRR